MTAHHFMAKKVPEILQILECFKRFQALDLPYTILLIGICGFIRGAVLAGVRRSKCFIARRESRFAC